MLEKKAFLSLSIFFNMGIPFLNTAEENLHTNRDLSYLRSLVSILPDMRPFQHIYSHTFQSLSPSLSLSHRREGEGEAIAPCGRCRVEHIPGEKLSPPRASSLR